MSPTVPLCSAHFWQQCHRRLEIYAEYNGRALTWLCLLMMIVLSAVVILRYGFNIGSIALQESVTYLHACVFMLAAGYTLKRGGHVRVDIFYRSFSPRNRAWVDSLGAIALLLPLCAYLFAISWEFVAQAWAFREGSPEPGGIPAVFLLKTLIPLLAVNLGLQGLATLIDGALLLTGHRSEGADRD